MARFFPIIVEESNKLNAEILFTYSIEDVLFRDVVPRTVVCLPHAKAIEATAFFWVYILAIVCNSRSAVVLPYCIQLMLNRCSNRSRWVCRIIVGM
jgi:hypothetical protein